MWLLGTFRPPILLPCLSSRDPHRGSMDDERNASVAGRLNECRPNRLLAQVLVHDSGLHTVHQSFTKATNNRGVDAGRQDAGPRVRGHWVGSEAAGECLAHAGSGCRRRMLRIIVFVSLA